MTTTRALFLSAPASLLFLLACGGAQPPAASANIAPSESAPLPVSTPAATPAEPADPNVRAVEAQRPALDRCYQKARGANPALGRCTVTFNLRADDTGKVTNVDLAYTHKFDEDAKSCVRDAAFNVKLPAGTKSASVPVVFDTPSK